jgi:hypothetical protein
MATILVCLIILAGIAYFYLKCNIMTSLTNLLAALMGCILAFSYYEQLAGLLASESWAVTWIQSATFLLIFFFGFLFIRVLSGFLAKSDFEVTRVAKLSVNLICGALTGILVSGILLVAVGLSPLPPHIFYSRYPLSQPIHLGISYPPVINADGFTASLYSWISRSSLSSSKSFAVLHADYLTRLHLNRYALNKGIPAVCSYKAIKLPAGNVSPVRLRDFPDQPRMTVVRLGISGSEIHKGGAAGKNQQVALIPAQVPLIAKEQDQAGNYTGSAHVIYPSGIMQNSNFEMLPLDQEMAEEVKNIRSNDRYLWLDLVYQVPQGQRAVLIAFKQNAILDLPKAVPSSEEIEKALNGE